MPLRKGKLSKLKDLTPAVAVQAAGGRNAAGLLMGSEAEQAQLEFEAPADPEMGDMGAICRMSSGVLGGSPSPLPWPPKNASARDDEWGDGQADISMPMQGV